MAGQYRKVLDDSQHDIQSVEKNYPGFEQALSVFGVKYDSQGLLSGAKVFDNAFQTKIKSLPSSNPRLLNLYLDIDTQGYLLVVPMGDCG